jgi:hypothetical protein
MPQLKILKWFVSPVIPAAALLIASIIKLNALFDDPTFQLKLFGSRWATLAIVSGRPK